MGPKITSDDTDTEGPIEKTLSSVPDGKPWVVDIQNPVNVNAVINVSSRRTTITERNQLQLHDD